MVLSSKLQNMKINSQYCKNYYMMKKFHFLILLLYFSLFMEYIEYIVLPFIYLQFNFLSKKYSSSKTLILYDIINQKSGTLSKNKEKFK